MKLTMTSKRASEIMELCIRYHLELELSQADKAKLQSLTLAQMTEANEITKYQSKKSKQLLNKQRAKGKGSKPVQCNVVFDDSAVARIYYQLHCGETALSLARKIEDLNDMREQAGEAMAKICIDADFIWLEHLADNEMLCAYEAYPGDFQSELDILAAKTMEKIRTEESQGGTK